MSTRRQMFIWAIVLVTIATLSCRNSRRGDLEQQLERLDERAARMSDEVRGDLEHQVDQLEKRTTGLTKAVRALSDATEELGKLIPEMRLAVIDVMLLRTGMMLTPLIPSPSTAGKTAVVIGPVKRSSNEQGMVTEVSCQVVFAGFSQGDTDQLSREELTAICTAIFSSFKAAYLAYFPDDTGASLQLNLFHMNSAQGPIQFATYSVAGGLIRK